MVTPQPSQRDCLQRKPFPDGPSQCDVRLQFLCVALVTEYPAPDRIIYAIVVLPDAARPQGHVLMALAMRRTGLGSGIDKDRPDYTVYCGEWRVGRISSAYGLWEVQRTALRRASAANLLAQSWNIIVRGMCREQIP